jgi:hypothetical protein
MNITDIPQADITISHTHADGTILTGSVKNDGVYEIVRQHGFTWRPVPGIFIRGSRDKPAQMHKINGAADALREAGHTVTVEIDDQWRPAAEREADREQRAADRADRLADRADRAAARGTALHDAGQGRLDRIPFGQPILAGHYSEGRDRRFRAGAVGQIDRGLAELNRAEQLADRAAAVEAHQRQRENPRVTMRRIERLETDLRATQRAGRDTSHLEEQITHWRGVLDALETAGEFVPWRPADFAKGDHVQVEGRLWYPVLRVNAKTVSVSRSSWPRTIPYDIITGRRRDGIQLDAPNSEPWPVEMARKVARWRDLLHSVDLPSNQRSYEPEAVRQRHHVADARRLALGLPTTACDAEVAAFTIEDRDTVRAYAVLCTDIYDRLQRGGSAAGVAASVTPVDCGEPAWRMPTGETEDRRVDQLQPGDIVKGFWDRTYTGRQLVTSFAGPVEHVTAVQHRHERGDWVTVRLVDGSERHSKTHMWFAVYPSAAHSLIAEQQDADAVRADDPASERMRETR